MIAGHITPHTIPVRCQSHPLHQEKLGATKIHTEFLQETLSRMNPADPFSHATEQSKKAQYPGMINYNC